jgi:AraC-like DNA-binding protein
MVDANELMVMLQGDSRILLAGRWHSIGPGAIAFFKRKTKYAIWTTAAFPREIISIWFVEPPKWQSSLPDEPIRLPSVWLRTLLDMDARCAFDSFGNKVIARGEVLKFIENLSAALMARQKAAPESGKSGRRPNTDAGWMEIWARAEDVIRQRAALGLTVEALSDAVHVSPATLRRVFLSARGVTPKAALSQHRIAHACELLTGGNLNITQVAQATGYATVQQFSSAFKKHTGKAPTMFVRR